MHTIKILKSLFLWKRVHNAWKQIDDTTNSLAKSSTWYYRKQVIAV